jgi:hypothetical protein
MGDSLAMRIPLRLDAKAGMNAHEGRWQVRNAKAARHRDIVGRHWLTIAAEARSFGLPLIIRLTRVAPSKMDSDGVVSSFKSIRDEVAARLGFDDRSELAFWLCGQRQGARAQRASKAHPAKSAEWGVEIVIERARCLACGELLSAAETKRTDWGLFHLHHDVPEALR